jgi:hypothetical protein
VSFSESPYPCCMPLYQLHHPTVRNYLLSLSREKMTLIRFFDEAPSKTKPFTISILKKLFQSCVSIYPIRSNYVYRTRSAYSASYTSLNQIIPGLASYFVSAYHGYCRYNKCLLSYCHHCLWCRFIGWHLVWQVGQVTLFGRHFLPGPLFRRGQM